MDKRQAVEEILSTHNFSTFKWIGTDEISVAHWVRMKCRFGCPVYGKNASCPPATPPVDECKSFIKEYEKAIVIQAKGVYAKDEERKKWTRELNDELVKIEREVFWLGYHKAFMLFLDDCSFCKKCTPNRDSCFRPKDARPSCEAMAIDVFETVRSAGFPIEVLTKKSQEMNRYAILLVD